MGEFPPHVLLAWEECHTVFVVHFSMYPKARKPWKTAHGTQNITKITRYRTHKQIYYSFRKISFISWLYFACYRFACNNNNNISKFGIVCRCFGGNFVLFLKEKYTILWWVADGVGIAWKAEIVIANVIIRTTRFNKTYSWISIKLNARKIMSKKQFIQIIKKWISNAKPWQTKNGLKYWIIWDSYYMLFKLMFHEFAKEQVTEKDVQQFQSDSSPFFAIFFLNEIHF